MRWLVIDSLYRPEQFPFSHLDSYAHYLREAGEDVRRYLVNVGPGDKAPLQDKGFVSWPADDFKPDVFFVLDGYDRMYHGNPYAHRSKYVAQVAALVNPMPWEVRKADGSPAYDLILSSIPALVEQARAAGCRAEFQQLCFDHRALICGMNVRDRDIPCLFLGTVDGNHQKRAAILRELGDLVTIAPPTFGRAYYELISRARVLVHVQAEWGADCRNSLRYYEGAGLGTVVVGDGPMTGIAADDLGIQADTPEEFRWVIEDLLAYEEHRKTAAEIDQAHVLQRHGYHARIPRLIEIVRSL